MKRLLATLCFLVAGGVAFPCDAHFSSGHMMMAPGETRSFDLSLVDCDFVADKLHVRAYVTGKKRSRSLTAHSKVELSYQDSNGVTFTGIWITVEPPTFVYTVSITNNANKVQKLRLRAVALGE